MPISYLPLSWDTYLTHIRALASRIFDEKKRVDVIVAISRGGLTLGHVLSDHLRIPIWTIAIQSYTDIQTRGEIKITGKLQTSIRNKRILLVDDVADSGHTFVRAINYLKRSSPKSITTLGVFYKPHSVFKPDYFAQTTSKWILFPYESTEMIILLAKKYGANGKWSPGLQTKLRELHFSQEQIDFVKRYYLKNS